jgi:membrane protein DedA with SNARE-associated domain
VANDQAVLTRIGRRARRHRLAAGLGFGLLGLLALLFLVIDDGNLLEAVGDVGPLTRALIHTFGGGAAFVLLYIEESGVPMVVPGDFVVMWVGHHVPREITAWTGAWLGLVAAVVLGSTNLYLVSRKWGRVLHLTPERMARAEGWFDRYGAWALIFGRHVFGLRMPLTVAAGIFKLPYPVFALSVAVSAGVWIAMFLFLGVTLGGHVAQFLRLYRQAVVPVGLAVLIIAAVVLAARLLPARTRTV